MNENEKIPVAVSNLFGLINRDDWFPKLVDRINELITNDFQKLVHILYRLDVSEEKLKVILKENPQEDAGKLIATLVIEREKLKMRTRAAFKSKNQDDNQEEKW